MHDREREKFAADELAVVLSQFNLGPIESITEFRRGSRRRPKVGIVCERGKFLLKRRPRAEAATRRVACAHRLQEHLTQAGYTLPRLVPAGDQGQLALSRGSYVYELFEYVRGQSYSGTGDETHSAGQALARFHRAVEGFEDRDGFHKGDYHDANSVRTALSTIPSNVDSHDSAMGMETELLETTGELLEAYEEACTRVDGAGLRGWLEMAIHSDWHPGNMLFRHHQVVAVIDYDSVRFGQGVIDIANATLQFAILTSKKIEEWPDELDERRARLFLEGYSSIRPIGREELACIPLLMIEALIAESVLPIAATGSFGQYQGFRFMKMVRRKVAWLRENSGRLADSLGTPTTTEEEGFEPPVPFRVQRFSKPSP